MDKKESKNFGPLTPSCKIVLKYLQTNDNPYIGAELSAATGIKGIHGVMNSLFIRGLIEKNTTERQILNGKGILIEKTCVEYRLTNEGRIFNIL